MKSTELAYSVDLDWDLAWQSRYRPGNALRLLATNGEKHGKVHTDGAATLMTRLPFAWALVGRGQARVVDLIELVEQALT